MNSHDVEDTMWDEYREYLEENGLKEDERFSKYMKENAYRVKELCKYCIENGMAKRIVPNSIRKVFAPF